MFVSPSLPSRVALAALVLSFGFSLQSHAANDTTKRPNTKIRHVLLFGLTNAVCDSVLSSAQCFETLQMLEPGDGPNFIELSDENWKLALDDMSGVIKSRVSESEEPRRYNAIRKLVLQAYQVNMRYNAPPGVDPAPERKAPESALQLSHFDISDVDIVHRLLISGDRLLVDHYLVDQTLAPTSATILAASRPTELTTNMPASFGASVATSTKSLSDESAARLKENAAGRSSTPPTTSSAK